MDKLMSQKEVKRAQILDMLKESKISQQETAKQMDITPRQARRIVKRYQESGLEGLISKKRGRASNRRLDDATSAIYSAFLVEEEGTASTFQGLAEVVAAHGLFCSFYTDRGSHYFHTPEAGGKVSKTHLTQVGRALKQLGIDHIAAYSPQARGRSERVFGTLQGRLPKDMALAGVTTVEGANRWLAETYIAQHNAQFAAPAEQEGSGFVPDRAGQWREILCVQEDRTVGNDNTLKWRNRSLQLPASPLRPHFVKANVRVHEYPHGQLAVFLGPHRLADFDADGAIIETNKIAA